MAGKLESSTRSLRKFSGNLSLKRDRKLEPTKPDFIAHLPRLTVLGSLPSLGGTRQQPICQISIGDNEREHYSHVSFFL